MAFQVNDPPPLPPPNVPVIDPQTGMIDRTWYAYLLQHDAAFRAMLKFLRVQFP